MADTRPTQITLVKKIHLCYLAIFKPTEFIINQDEDAAKRNNFSDKPPKEEHSVWKVRRALGYSLLAITITVIIGWLVGRICVYFFPSPKSFIIYTFQIIGAGLLLWATLFVRGFEIETYCGVTLIERVNRWIYQFLYCMGTFVVVFSLVWSIG